MRKQNTAKAGWPLVSEAEISDHRVNARAAPLDSSNIGRRGRLCGL